MAEDFLLMRLIFVDLGFRCDDWMGRVILLRSLQRGRAFQVLSTANLLVADNNNNILK